MNVWARPWTIFLQISCLLWAAGLSEGCRAKRKISSAPLYEAPPQNFAEELKPLLDAYVVDAAMAGVPVNPMILKELRQVVWVSEIPSGSILNNATLGKCRRLNENHPDPSRRYRIIEVTKPDARMMAGSIKVDPLTLKVILYHEFGHCLHDYRSHRPEGEDSIMSTRLAKSRYSRLEALIQEHFDLLRNKDF